MTEPIGDKMLQDLQRLVDYGGKRYCEVDRDVLDGLLARLDAAEAKLARLVRRYAALPVLIAALREACCDGAWCRFCEADLDEDGSIPHDDDCPGIAALKAAGVDP